jgi:secreted PhoX family phosphatase
MSQTMNRRSFLSTAIATAATLSLGNTLLGLSGCSSSSIVRPVSNLVSDPRGLCDLPPGFGYTVISASGETMSDGHAVPGFHDGMGCFAAPDGGVVLVRNHEIPLYFPFDPKSPVPELAYDPDASGGTTTVWLDDRLQVTRHHLSLTGTILNCGGGTTPWGTWISCEEVREGGGWVMGKRHGYNFEVDPRQPLRRAQPLRAMGRFRHEAVAVDPASGIAYQTEDTADGCFYRFLPKVRGRLAQGGILQALRFVDRSLVHTTDQPLQPKRRYPCDWVTIADPDPEEDTVRLQAEGQGAAIFVRGEGLAIDADGIYFSCTTGGAQGRGQIFRFVPERDHRGGTVELVYEATTEGVLDRPDNLAINAWGDLVICEDTRLDTRCLAGLTPEGRLYYIAANTRSEWCGACFSPDGRTLFANIQREPGLTVAIRGPWEALRASA